MQAILATLLRILVFLSILLLVVRYLRSLFGGPKKQKGSPGSETNPNPMVRDPICGMYLDPRLAIRTDYKQQAFYFCSDECRKKFLAKASQAGPR